MRGERETAGPIAKKVEGFFLPRLSKFLLRAKKKRGGLTGDKSQTQARLAGKRGGWLFSPPPLRNSQSSQWLHKSPLSFFSLLESAFCLCLKSPVLI